MATVHPGATLVPHFRDFLPGWLSRQPWYQGDDRQAVSAVGFLRLEDPAGQVGIETHLMRAGGRTYQVPMTYRGAPVDGVPLIATAEHSVLGTRWIYDGEFDPVWRAELLRLVSTGGVSASSGERVVGAARARGRLLVTRDPDPATTVIELRRLLVPDGPDIAPEPGVVGVVTGSWHPDGPDAPAVTCCLAVLREATPDR